MNETMKSSLTNAIYGVSEYEQAFEYCDSCYNSICISYLHRIYDKQENCYKFCNDCFDGEPKNYVKTGEYLGGEYGCYYFKD